MLKVKWGKTKRKLYFYVNKLRKHYYPYVRRTTPLFSHINIQTTSYCTRKCDFCFLGNPSLVQKNEKMEDRIFKKIIDDLEEVNYSGRVSLFEINEPLTDDRICTFIEYIRKKLPRAFQFLNTNGDLLTLEILDELFHSGLDHLIISCYDDKGFNKTNKLIDQRDYNCTVQDKRKNKFFFHDNRGGYIKDPNMFQPVRDMFCERVFKQLYIKPSGNVVSCVADHEEINFVGNVKERSVLELWFSKEFENIRKYLRVGDRSNSQLCIGCNYVGDGGIYRVPKFQRFMKKINHGKEKR